MININAQDWLNEKYPVNGTCQRKADQKNKNKTRAEITELDISKGSLGKHFYSTGDGDKNLIGSLKLEGFTNLRKLVCSGHELIGLDISECSNLEEVDISGCSELSRDNIKTSLSYDELSGNLMKEPQITPAGDKIRNILIVGITGNGKSALANVLADNNQFEESSASASKTKGSQNSDIFEWKGKQYRVIDNIGFGDTNNIREEDILLKIAEGIREAKEGINQILFVFKDRFSPNHIEVYKTFEKFISKSGIAGFTTLIRTNFENFRTRSAWESDKSNLLNQNGGEIIKTCKGIIYVNNPPMPVMEVEDDEDIKEEKE